jgi:hypothetical protein
MAEILAQFGTPRRLNRVNDAVAPDVVEKHSHRTTLNANDHRLLQRGTSASLLALILAFAGALAWPGFARAQDELPGRVGRIAEFGGDIFVAPQDQPEQWVAVGLNYPIASGDNFWVAKDGHAEIDFGGGQLRLGDNTNLHVSRLDERSLALFIAQGGVVLRVRVLDPGDTASIDTPNAQVVLTRPGLYRIEVSDDRQHTQLAVREGEANVLVSAAGQQVLPGQSAGVDGGDPQEIVVRDGFTTDGFDTWSAQRDRIYERGRASSYVSRQMVGYADLDANGTWETVADYGAVWYPSAVAPDWAPYSDGYWTDVSGWGSTWVDAAPWGYAPFHYGRWAHIHGRWGWCPGSFVARPVWAPALVGWVGGPGWSVSPGRSGSIYGWVPLGWGEAYRPPPGRCGSGCWERYNRPYAVNPASRTGTAPLRLANAGVPGAMTAVQGGVIASRKPVPVNRISVPGNLVASAPLLLQPPSARPEPGRVAGIKPGNGVPRPASTMYATNARRGAPNPFASVPAGTGVAAGSSVQQGASGTSSRSGTSASSAPGAGPAHGATPSAGATNAPEAPVRAAPPAVASPDARATRLAPAAAGLPTQVNTSINPPGPARVPPPERAADGQAQPAIGRTAPPPRTPPSNGAPLQPGVSPTLPAAGPALVRPAPQLSPPPIAAPPGAPPAGTPNIRPAPQLPPAAIPVPQNAPSAGAPTLRAAPQLPATTRSAPPAQPSSHPVNVVPPVPPPANQPAAASPANPAIRAPTGDKEKATVPANANPNALPGNGPTR